MRLPRRPPRWLAVTLTGFVLGISAPDHARARRVQVACADGDPTCDQDRACDGVCHLVLGAHGTPVAVPLHRRGAAPGRRVRRVDRHLVVVRCLLPTTPCKPPLTSGCRDDLAARACAAHGGDYDARGLNPTPSCHCHTADAGTPCARTFRCGAHVTEFGCFAVLDDHGTRLALCVD